MSTAHQRHRAKPHLERGALVEDGRKKGLAADVKVAVRAYAHEIRPGRRLRQVAALREKSDTCPGCISGLGQCYRVQCLAEGSHMQST